MTVRHVAANGFAWVLQRCQDIGAQMRKSGTASLMTQVGHLIDVEMRKQRESHDTEGERPARLSVLLEFYRTRQVQPHRGLSACLPG